MDAVAVNNILLLAATWINVSLYTLELVLCRRYFQRPNRPRIYRAAVGALVVFDTVCTLTICVNACFVVLNLAPRADPVALLSPTSVAIFLTYFSAAVEQTILCHLFYTLSKNILVTGILAIVVLTHMGLACASGALILVLNSEMSAAFITAQIGSITCAAADIFIAVSLGSRVWKMLSPTDVIPAAESFVRKFLLLVVSSGLIVASNTLIMMVLLLKRSPVFDFFFSCLGRVYSVTLLANFLVGIYFRRDSTMDTSSQSRRGANPSLVMFDVVAGYDTESASQNASGPRMGAVESKPPSTHPGPGRPRSFNYNSGIDSPHVERRPALRVRSEP